MVLITHPKSKKNFGIDQNFERFSETHKDDKLMTTVMSGHNESESFFNPQKLPSIVYFKRDEKNQVTPVQMGRKELLKSFDLNGQSVN